LGIITSKRMRSGGGLPDLLEGLLTVHGGADLVPLPPEEILQHPEVQPLVVHHQDVSGSRQWCSSSPSPK